MNKQIYQKDLKQLYHQLKHSANKRDIEFTLSLNDLYELSFPITCPILGMPLVFNKGVARDNSYSVDRIYNNKGYEKDNIVIVSNRANTLKSNATLDEMKKLAEFYTIIEEDSLPL